MYNMNFYFVVFFVCGGKLIFVFFNGEKKMLEIAWGHKKGETIYKRINSRH
jgi:hypothetical protein